MPVADLSDPGVSDVAVVLCDLDGVVWLAHEAIAGAPDAIRRLRAGGRRVLFVTNNSMSPVEDVEAALAAIGVSAGGDVITSAQAAASLVRAGERVLVAGGVGVEQAVEQRGAAARRGPGHTDVDAVIVGLHRDFDFEGLRAASSAIRSGARFIATNDDATFPTPAGPDPGGGALVAAVQTAAETQPTIAGKPHRPMADLVADRCGPDYSPGHVVMVGDRVSTDGLFAATIGCRFALVRSGVTPPGAPIDDSIEVAIDAASLADFADTLEAR